MRYLPITLPTPAENLAFDEVLLNAPSEQGAGVLRVWESPTPVVVVGRASRVEKEVDTDACRRLGIPVLRRVSGGATIVAGPGCLMYAVTLNLADRLALESIDYCHDAVLGPLAEALRCLEPTVHRAGTSDLAYERAPHGPLQKFSGNSLRITRGRLLYHGTLLYDFDLTLLTTLLRTPPRQPDYREGRDHKAFVANLPAARETLTNAVASAWETIEVTHKLAVAESQAVAELVTTRYELDSWNLAR